jgi:RimJ/RimL family protein N-acetyltransferase
VTPRIETERLLLRLPRLDDADAAAEYLADPEVMRYLGGQVVPRADAPAVVQKWIDRWEATGVGQFVIERCDDGRVLGRVGLLVWDTRDWSHATFSYRDENAQPELGWVLARDHWGHGYATEAAVAAREWSRRECGIARLISLIEPANVRSQRVAERLGASRGESVMLSDAGRADVWAHPEVA